MSKEIYSAIRSYSDGMDYYEHTVFVSLDKDKVETWVNKFNRIIKENESRLYAIRDADVDEDFPLNLWYDIVTYERPFATIRTNELR